MFRVLAVRAHPPFRYSISFSKLLKNDSYLTHALGSEIAETAIHRVLWKGSEEDG